LVYGDYMTEFPSSKAPIRIVALIVAAGSGQRSGLDRPKQFEPLAGTSVLSHSVRAFQDHPLVSGIQLVIGAGQHDQCRAALAPLPLPECCHGGATRQLSVLAGLEAIAARGGCDLVLIHDAARPGLPAAVIDRLIAALDRYDGAVPVLPVADSLSQGDGDLLGTAIDRDGLWRVQTPQAFRFGPLLAAHRAWNPAQEATDDARLAQSAGLSVTRVDGDFMLDKLTFAEDFARMEAMMTGPLISRTGMGFDVHRFTEGDIVHLCGVPVPHDRALAGHSDADVALHALTDALLGAIADGDIGQHFPPSDPQWRGAVSHRFVEFARDRISARGGIIDHVDLTIICEAPKVGPHRDAMRAALSTMLRLDLDRISVKATTTEQLGFTGRREGIAAQAVVSVRSRSKMT
jgi:2-C-methyl-D-erythritol 4-phosphate cytidylyltransferase/2-C-methyl-D-erythritol 2,4-cyclodiphosphate synthase